jgi:hypothetical protein
MSAGVLMMTKSCESALMKIEYYSPMTKTSEKRFFVRGFLHQGVILLRLEDERASSKILVLSKLLQSYSDRLVGSFVVVTEDRVRFAHG